jgi:WhiB family redox-sensing transcriptional regulator
MAGKTSQEIAADRARYLQGALCEICHERPARYGNIEFRDEANPLVCGTCYIRKKRTGRYLPMRGPRYEKDQAWRDQAACATHPVEMFFPSVGGSAAAARAVCRSCPVIEQCTEFILSVPTREDEYGIWADMSPRQRAKERVRRGLAQPSGHRKAANG